LKHAGTGAAYPPSSETEIERKMKKSTEALRKGDEEPI
jgi:hypothetical protein